ncbi:MAG: hypothetical protein GY880_04745 [Planctomycetaceae bacterium]|nr:hypothetical protein [Planctomycetaceae bacterium]MCP4476530.1 hypothetical protein [Planctomycetaceae bacterium]MCP4773525.1 hypothetical protein [Planctomycetaceae bacterium]
MSLVAFASLTNYTDAQTDAPRPLAKGVLKTVPENLDPRDMFSLPMAMPDLNATKFDPNTIAQKKTLFGQSRSVVMFRNNVWQYEFSFTGLRQAKLRIPTGNGKAATRNYWYMVYRIRDTGQTMTINDVKQNPKFDHITKEIDFDKSIASQEKKFLPRFTLEGWVPVNKGYQKVSYRDTISPIALEQIRQKEDPNQVLFDSHQMSQAKIPAAKNDTDRGVWGVAIWENVDPRIDFVSVFVQGLTNAFRLSDPVSAPSKLKTLQLNFWRPGDSVNETSDFVKFGIPLIDDPAMQALVTKRYNLPGPILRGYFKNEEAKRDVLVTETDAQVNLKDFNSAIAPSLDQGKMPPSILKSFENAGIALDANTPLTTLIPGKKWSFKQGKDNYTLVLEPQFWEKDFDGIRFIKSLDNMWIYR